MLVFGGVHDEEWFGEELRVVPMILPLLMCSNNMESGMIFRKEILHAAMATRIHVEIILVCIQ
jgi:hypothetical protein